MYFRIKQSERMMKTINPFWNFEVFFAST